VNTRVQERCERGAVVPNLAQHKRDARDSRG
jgi:hypothetical protein